MNAKKRFEGIWNASAAMRYKHFKSYVADQGSVWMLSNEEGFTTIDLDGYIHLLVWPSKEFAEAFDSEETPVEIEIHDFCQRCEDMVQQKEVCFLKRNCVREKVYGELKKIKKTLAFLTQLMYNTICVKK